MLASSTASDSFADAIGDQVAARLLDGVRGVLVVADDDTLTGSASIASYLGVSRRHVDRYAGTTIPARRIGNRWVSSKAALVRWLADGVAQASRD